MEKIAIEHAERLAHVEEAVKAAHKRIDRIDELTKSVYKLASSIEGMQGKITEMSERLQSIEEKPGKRWDLIVTSAITTIVGALIGYLLNI